MSTIYIYGIPTEIATQNFQCNTKSDIVRIAENILGVKPIVHFVQCHTNEELFTPRIIDVSCEIKYYTLSSRYSQKVHELGSLLMGVLQNAMDDVVSSADPDRVNIEINSTAIDISREVYCCNFELENALKNYKEGGIPKAYFSDKETIKYKLFLLYLSAKEIGITERSEDTHRLTREAIKLQEEK